MEEVFNNVFNIINAKIQKPEEFLSVQNETALDLKNATKCLYDFTKQLSRRNNNALPELVTEGFDEEQIWQQLELQNEELTYFAKNVPDVIGNENFVLPSVATNVEVSDKDDEEDEENGRSMVKEDKYDTDSEWSNEEDLSENLLKEHKDTLKKEKNKKHKKASVVDDMFFKLDKLDEYLTKQEKKEKLGDNGSDSADDESVDLFNRFSDDEDVEEQDAKLIKYADFFDSPESEEEGRDSNNDRKDVQDKSEEDLFFADDVDSTVDEDSDKEERPAKKVKFNLTTDSDETDSTENKTGYQVEDTEAKSSLEERQERLEKRIKNLEDEALSEKPWQLRGEISADKRPQNSLLEEFVEFDLTTRPPPVITEETTKKLEDIIKRRIKDKAWDDVERKFKPVETPREYKKQLVLDQEKSKESLAQIYEREYIKQKQALNPDGQEEEQEEEPKLHKEIREEMHSLFAKLDALSNFHYTPKPAKPELKIVSNVPAINMEEVAPVAMSDAALLAPEEIKEKERGVLTGKAERSSTDLKRERRRKKLRQRERQKAKEKKEKLDALKPSLSKKHTKSTKKFNKERNVIKTNETSDKVVRTSSKFFSELENEVKSQIRSKINKASKKNKDTLSAVKLKL